jgi:uncharacterized protein (TIGR02594 family)
MPKEPPWLVEARASVGLREIPGALTAPTIQRWLTELGAWWRDDETPWCGVAVAAWMRAAGQPLPKHWYRAKGWLDWGVPLQHPDVGAVVVFEREGGGHVGLVVGRDLGGRLMVLGGNQGNAVNVRAFLRERVVGFRWPSTWVLPAAAPLPLLGAGELSASEA